MLIWTDRSPYSDIQIIMNNSSDTKHRQIGALQRRYKYLDFNSRKTLYKSLDLAKHNYCPLRGVIVDKTNFDILENVIDKRLLLEHVKDISFRLWIMRFLALQVFNYLRGLSLFCLYLK